MYIIFPMMCQTVGMLQACCSQCFKCDLSSLQIGRDKLSVTMTASATMQGMADALMSRHEALHGSMAECTHPMHAFRGCIQKCWAIKLQMCHLQTLAWGLGKGV